MTSRGNNQRWRRWGCLVMSSFALVMVSGCSIIGCGASAMNGIELGGCQAHVRF